MRGHGARVMVLASITSIWGCSYTLVKQPPASPSPFVRQYSSCNRKAPLADTMIGAGLIGAAIGAITLAGLGDDGDTLPILSVAGVLVGSGAIFLFSSHYGSGIHDACAREELAASLPPAAEPHRTIEPLAAASCEQRRLDLYTRAVTQADTALRKDMLDKVPVCHDTAARERAWLLTKSASLAAGAGLCDDVEPIVREVRSIDVALHDVVMLSDVEIKYCLSRREL